MKTMTTEMFGRAEATSRDGRGAAGFTLIEVLIAAVLLALGALSLLVLFAGAATQQRLASESTQSLLTTKSAEATIGPRFGRMAGPALGAVSTGEWFVLPVDEETVGDSREPGSSVLTIDPLKNGSLYFVVEEEGETSLYEYQGQEQSPGNALFAGRYRHDTGEGDVPSGNDSGVFLGGNARRSTLSTFAHSRLDPSTLNDIFVVVRERRETPEGTEEFRDLAPIRYALVNEAEALSGFGPDFPPNPLEPGGFRVDPNDDILMYTPSGSVDPDDYILLDVNGKGGPNEIEDVSPGGLVSFSIESVHQESISNPIPSSNKVPRYVSRIYADGYGWRTAELSDRRDRVSLDRNGDPKSGYAVLYRTTTTGATQMALATYLIRGSAEEGAAFVPVERVDRDGQLFRRPADDHPLQRVTVRLAYDDERERYFVRPTDREENWSIEAGQFLLIEKGPRFDDGGADAPVRVVSQLTVDGERRGYLDRVPRVNGRTMLPDRGRTETLEAFAVQDVIRDVEGVSWRLEPGGMRIFQVR